MSAPDSSEPQGRPVPEPQQDPSLLEYTRPQRWPGTWLNLADHLPDPDSQGWDRMRGIEPWEPEAS